MSVDITPSTNSAEDKILYAALLITLLPGEKEITADELASRHFVHGPNLAIQALNYLHQRQFIELIEDEPIEESEFIDIDSQFTVRISSSRSELELKKLLKELKCGANAAPSIKPILTKLVTRTWREEVSCFLSHYLSKQGLKFDPYLVKDSPEELMAAVKDLSLSKCFHSLQTACEKVTIRRVRLILASDGEQVLLKYLADVIQKEANTIVGGSYIDYPALPSSVAIVVLEHCLNMSPESYLLSSFEDIEERICELQR